MPKPCILFSKPNEIKNGPWANVSTRVNNVES
jgi:hypothetical protein